MKEDDAKQPNPTSETYTGEAHSAASLSLSSSWEKACAHALTSRAPAFPSCACSASILPGPTTLSGGAPQLYIIDMVPYNDH